MDTSSRPTAVSVTSGASSPAKVEAMPGRPQTPRLITAQGPITLAAAIVVIAALYFGRDLLIPIALALLLSFFLGPVVNRLRRWGLRRVPAVLVTVGFGCIVIAIVAFVVTFQVVELANSLPQYQNNIEQKLQSLRATPGGSVDRLTQMFSGLINKFSNPEQAGPPVTSPGPVETSAPVDTPATGEPPPKPVAVQVVRPSLTPLDVFGNLLGTTLGPLTSAGIVFVFVIFILLERENIRNRLIRLLGHRPGQLLITTQALDDAATRVSRFLFMQLVVNICYGVPIGVGLYFIGVPNPVLWGLLAIVLRFVPYIGPWIAAAVPLALTFAVTPGWGMLIATIALYVVVEIITYNVVETWLFGTTTGVSSVGILLSAVFWGWLWGPIGLLMSTPLTVCFVVIGRYIPALSFFPLLLGDQPVLPLHARVYQRLLAMDPDEPDELARKYLADHTVEQFYGDVLVPLLRLLEEERHHNTLEQAHREFILENVRNLIEDVSEHPDPDVAPKSSATGAPGTTGAPGLLTTETLATTKPDGPTDDASADSSFSTGKLAPESPPMVMCIPAYDEADELVARMLSILLRRRMIPASALSVNLPPPERLERLGSSAPRVVCISALPPFATVHARQTVKRIRIQAPQIKIVMGYWDTDTAAADLERRLTPAGAAIVVTTLNQALVQLIPLVETRPPSSNIVHHAAQGEPQKELTTEDTEITEEEKRL